MVLCGTYALNAIFISSNADAFATKNHHKIDFNSYQNDK